MRARPALAAPAALLLVALLGNAPAQADLPSRPEVQRCLSALQAADASRAGKDDDDDGDTTVDDGGADCAQLLRVAARRTDAAAEAGLAESLAKVGAEGLRDYLASLPPAAEDRLVHRGHVPDPATLAPILAGLPQAQAARRGFWERAYDWLQRLLHPKSKEDPGASSWLGRLLSKMLGAMPPQVAKWLGWALFAGLVGFLIYVIVREIRIAVAGRERRAQRPRAQAGVPTAPLPANAPRAPDALLRWVIGRLVGQSRLPDAPALTNAELGGRLPDREREDFGAVARGAEDLLFGDRWPDAAELEALHARAVAVVVPPAAGRPA